MKKIIFFILLFSLCSCGVSANEYTFDRTQSDDLYSSMYDDYEIGSLENGVSDEFSDYAKKNEITPKDPFSFQNIFTEDGFNSLKEHVTTHIMSPLKSAGIMLIAIIVCALCASLSDNSLGVNRTMNTAAVLICTVSFMVPLTSLITKSIGTITAISAFMLIFIPIFAGILIASLRSGTAAGFQTVLFFVTQAVSYAATYIVLPFTNCFLAVSIAGCVSGSARLSGISSMLKKSALIIISAAMAVFLAVLSVQSAVSGAADTATQKTAKFFISSFVPIIGPSVSEALGSLNSCVGVLKSSVGIYAVIAILFMSVPLLIEVLLYKAVLSFCGSAAAVFGISPIKEISSALNSALSIILSVVICVSLMFIFGITVVSISRGAI